jgi:translation initiation factor 2B subunit (eIF-2B alpha/beta/delta family)
LLLLLLRLWCVFQVVLEVLLSAARQGKRFRVLVVDGRPELEGRQMMRRLLQVSKLSL